MSIIGGAVFPAIMGCISDMSSIRYAFWIHSSAIFMYYFAAAGYCPAPEAPKPADMPSVPVEN